MTDLADSGSSVVAKKTVAATAVLMIIMTFGSKALGFIREMTLAAYFGASYVVDAYVMSYNIPNILFAGFFVAIGTAYMPLFSKISVRQGRRDGNVFTSQIILLLLFFSLTCSFLGFVVSDRIVSIFAPGFSGETARLTSFFLKITFSFSIFTSLMSLLDGFLTYNNVFIPQICVDYFQNAAVIAAIIISAHFGNRYLLFGLMGGYIARCVVLFFIAGKKGMHLIPQFSGMSKTISLILPLALPVFIGTTIQEINVFVDRYMASSLPVGRVSALNYANQVNMLVMTVSVTVLTTLIYPKLTLANSNNDKDRFVGLLQKGFGLILVIAVPCALGAIVYSQQIVSLIYQRGAFTHEAVLLTSSAYRCFSIGLVFLALNDYITRAYYSLHEMRTPMYFAAIGIVVNICLNLLLVRSMGHYGLALSSSVAAIVNSTLLFSSFTRRYRQYKLLVSWKRVFWILVIAIASIGISYLIYCFAIQRILLAQNASFALAFLSAILLYVFMLKALKVEDLLRLVISAKKSAT